MKQFRVVFAVLGAVSCIVGAVIAGKLLQLPPLYHALQKVQTRVLINRNSLSQRVAAAGGHSGSVEIALLWNNKNDLDLSCVEPDGYRIWYADKTTPSPSGGTLDIDANSNVYALTATPVEHIVWPYGRAPVGPYRIYVTYFAQHDTVKDTPYTVQVIDHGKVSSFNGVMTSPGERIKIDTLQVSNHPGLTLAWLKGMLTAVLAVAIWTSCVVFFLAASLLVGLQIVFKLIDRAVLLSWKRLLLLLILSTLFGFIAGGVGQISFSAVIFLFNFMRNWMTGTVLDYIPFSLIEHIAGFVTLGLVTGISLSYSVPKIPRVYGVLAGFIGGFIGAVIYLNPPGSDTYEAGRVAAACILGGAIGMTITLITDLVTEYAAVVQEVGTTLVPMHLQALRTGAAGALCGDKKDTENGS